MSEAKVIFTFNGNNIIIKSLLHEKMSDICQRYVSKIRMNFNNLIFLYGGNQLNFELSFEKQANSIDKSEKEMKILVYEKQLEDFICPNCGEKINLNSKEIDEIILLNNNINGKINGVKSILDNIIKNSLVNSLNNQLKNINEILKTLNEDIAKNNEKLEKLLYNSVNNSVNNDFKDKNFIRGMIDINSNDINQNIVLFNSNINNNIVIYLNNKKINVIKDCNKWTYNFQKEGKYKFEIVFNRILSNMKIFFYECFNITF